MTSWGGRKVQAVRKQWAQQLPLPCLRCGEMVYRHQVWHVGHRIPRSLRPDLQWEQENQWPEHATCNLAGQTSIPTTPTVDRRPW